MTLDQVIKLGEMGFSKADIMVLVGSPAEPTAPIQDPIQEPIVHTPAQAPIQEPAPTPEPGVTLSNDQFTQLMQRMTQANSGIDIPPIQDATDVLASRLNAIFGIGGGEKK